VQQLKIFPSAQTCSKRCVTRCWFNTFDKSKTISPLF